MTDKTNFSNRFYRLIGALAACVPPGPRARCLPPALGQLRADTDIEMAIDLMLGAPVCRWLVTAEPVDAGTARRVVDTVWESL